VAALREARRQGIEARAAALVAEEVALPRTTADQAMPGDAGEQQLPATLAMT
jgi:hypothetical protein